MEDKYKKDIGNLNNDVFKCELDAKKKLKLVEGGDKGQKAFYNGKPMKYMDYIQEVVIGLKGIKKAEVWKMEVSLQE